MVSSFSAFIIEGLEILYILLLFIINESLLIFIGKYIFVLRMFILYFIFSHVLSSSHVLYVVYVVYSVFKIMCVV